MKRLLPLLALVAFAAWTPPPAAWAGETAAPAKAKKHVAKKKTAVKSGKRIAKKPSSRHGVQKTAPQPATINPYLPTAPVAMAPMSPPPAAPVVSLTPPAATPPAPSLPPFTYNPPFNQTWTSSAPNPYLVNAVRPAPAVTAPVAPAPAVPQSAAPAPAYQAAAPASSPATLPSVPSFSLRSLLPDMPPADQSILPSIKKVQPTGEKPLYVLTFKCPTELIGITPIPTKALHGLVDGTFNVVNASNLLPFNMQQVCQ